ncbi:MAG: HD-GYP domain-containing protein [Candidatus Omnitrophica bacterium]|nr:HD-GYP domain-containing protein [Candidatus Omnitrophota bacterium]
MKTNSKDKALQIMQVREAYEDMLVRIAITAEYKDPGAGGHISRVSDYSTAIARSLGIPEDEVEVLRYASMMHDIGKIGIPDIILEKATSLSPEERKKIEEHTIIGGRIFEGSTSPIVMASAQIALTHHERYDGTGYPKGLKGEDIPLYGRIVSVADYFDAFVSERHYKKAWSFDDALADISKKTGSSFDPRIVSAFLGVKETIRQILDANNAIMDFVKNGKN